MKKTFLQVLGCGEFGVRVKLSNRVVSFDGCRLHC